MYMYALADSGGGGARPPFEIPKRVFKEGQRGRTPPAPPPPFEIPKRVFKRDRRCAPPPFHKSWIRPWYVYMYVCMYNLCMQTYACIHVYVCMSLCMYNMGASRGWGAPFSPTKRWEKEREIEKRKSPRAMLYL